MALASAAKKSMEIVKVYVSRVFLTAVLLKDF